MHTGTPAARITVEQGSSPMNAAFQQVVITPYASPNAALPAGVLFHGHQSPSRVAWIRVSPTAASAWVRQSSPSAAAVAAAAVQASPADAGTDNSQGLDASRFDGSSAKMLSGMELQAPEGPKGFVRKRRCLKASYAQLFLKSTACASPTCATDSESCSPSSPHWIQLQQMLALQREQKDHLRSRSVRGNVERTLQVIAPKTLPLVSPQGAPLLRLASAAETSSPQTSPVVGARSRSSQSVGPSSLERNRQVFPGQSWTSYPESRRLSIAGQIIQSSLHQRF